MASETTTAGTIHQYPPLRVGKPTPTAAKKIGGVPTVAAVAAGPSSSLDVDVTPSLQSVIDGAASGDCIYIAPGTYKLAEPLAVRRDLFIMGFDDADGRRVVLEYDGGCLTPALASLRIEDDAKVVISAVQISYSHDVDASDPARASQTHAIRVFSGSLELRSCAIVSTVCGVDVREGATFTAVASEVSVACVAVDSSGRAHLSRGTVAGCTVGLRAAASLANVTCDDTLFITCGAAVVVEELAEACIRNARIKQCRLGVVVRSHSTRADPVSVIGTDFIACHRGVIIQGQCCNPTIAKCTFDACIACGVCVDSGSPEITGCAVTNTPVGMEILSGEARITECAIDDFSDVGILVSGPSTMPRILRCLIRADASRQRARATELVPGEIARGLLAAAAAELGDAGSTALPQTVPTIGIAIEETSAPHLEDNTFDLNGINVFGFQACGVVEANVLGVTEFDSVVFVGANGNIVIRDNDFSGAQRGTGVGIYCGTRAIVRRNKMDGMQLAAITLRGCGETEVTENEITDCQDAIVIMGESYGKAHRNVTDLAVVVFTDAVATFGSGSS